MGGSNIDMTFVPMKVTRNQARKMIKQTLNEPTNLNNQYAVTDNGGNRIYFS